MQGLLDRGVHATSSLPFHKGQRFWRLDCDEAVVYPQEVLSGTDGANDAARFEAAVRHCLMSVPGTLQLVFRELRGQPAALLALRGQPHVTVAAYAQAVPTGPSKLAPTSLAAVFGNLAEEEILLAIRSLSLVNECVRARFDARSNLPFRTEGPCRINDAEALGLTPVHAG